jgi:hypothetical protein
MQQFILLAVVIASLGLTACKSGGRSSDTSASETAQERNPLVPRQFGPNYKYNELMIKDYDEMLAMVQEMARKAHDATSKEDTGGEGEAVEWYGRSLKLVFSRPDSDNMVAKLVGEVRRDLQGFNAYEDTIAGIAEEAIRNASDSGLPVSVQSTALVILENIGGEIRPSVENGNADMRRIMERIRDADLRISSDVKKDRRLRGMFLTKNPSDEARSLLKQIDAKNKKKK